jgi:hypothetical protein
MALLCLISFENKKICYFVVYLENIEIYFYFWKHTVNCFRFHFALKIINNLFLFSYFETLKNRSPYCHFLSAVY